MQQRTLVAISILPVFVTVLILLWQKINPSLVCWENIDGLYKCRLDCQHGYFALPGMSKCLAWLNCAAIRDLRINGMIGQGLVKQVFSTYWEDHIVAYSKLHHKEYQEDFQHGLEMLKGLQPSRLVVQLLGFCENVYITEYHPLQDIGRLDTILLDYRYIKFNNVSTRFHLCIDYVKILTFLHNSPLGIRVMCDSNDLEKTLQQFLLTDGLHVIVNDLDALPEVDHVGNKTIKCGHKQLFGNFVAPEQLWLYSDRNFQDEEMLGYDEKTDIWKIPDVCHYFLNDSPESEVLKFHLFNIHKQCKQMNSSLRVGAQEVLISYQRVRDELNL